MNKFHIVYRYPGEFTTSGVVMEAGSIITAISEFYEQYPNAYILSVNTQELVDLMASARG